MKYAIIENGVVANIAESDAALAENWVQVDDTVHIDYLYDGTTFTKPALVVVVPTSVSPRQIRQALTRAGLRTQVESAVAAGDQDMKDWWEFATAFERAHPMVTAMGAALGVTEQQLDDLWILAGSL